VVCSAPRGPGKIVGPRPLLDLVVRPLNFTVRRRSEIAQASLTRELTDHTSCEQPYY
jgi:hypothetical protein